jgi:hypothetical protein
MTIENTIESEATSTRRSLFMILSPRSLPYANLALVSLFRNAFEPFELKLLTDSIGDKETLIRELIALDLNCQMADRNWSVLSKPDLDERATEQFARFKNILTFRNGHPCWRKITDPILLSDHGQEVIILDPDIYFPNKFQFETTPQNGLLLMWQKPSCLLPPEIVQKAIHANIPLAHHTDIGVAQWTMPIDLDWLDWLIGKLGAPNLPRNMHIESIVWAALAMRLGGGYLDPENWRCWHRSQLNRVMRKLGVHGSEILAKEPWPTMKCFHAGGEAKWWLSDAHEQGKLRGDSNLVKFSSTLPFVELTPVQYAQLQRRRLWLRNLGYYRFFG